MIIMMLILFFYIQKSTTSCLKCITFITIRSGWITCRGTELDGERYARHSRERRICRVRRTSAKWTRKKLEHALAVQRSETRPTELYSAARRTALGSTAYWRDRTAHATRSPVCQGRSCICNACNSYNEAASKGSTNLLADPLLKYMDSPS